MKKIKNLNINILYNLKNIEYFFLFKQKKDYLKKRKFSFLDNVNVGKVVFIELINYEDNNIRKYFFLGLCICLKKGLINSRIILRNILGNVIVEQQFLLFNNLLLFLRISKKRIILLGLKKSKLYFLNNLPFFFRINKLVVNETFFYSSNNYKKI